MWRSDWERKLIKLGEGDFQLGRNLYNRFYRGTHFWFMLSWYGM